MHAIITAGGTQVPIDDVRRITNLATGLFPWQIAQSLSRQGITITLIGSESLFREVKNKIPPNITFKQFVTYDDLATLIAQEIKCTPPDLFLMGAAVSDYGLEKAVKGKISSNQKILTIRLTRLPKILPTLRRLCPTHTRIIGFKLTSQATPDELLKAAHTQLRNSEVDLVVANDAAKIIKPITHPVTLVGQERKPVQLEGTEKKVANLLATYLIKAYA